MPNSAKAQNGAVQSNYTNQKQRTTKRTIIYWTIVIVLLVGSIMTYVFTDYIWGEDSVFNKEFSNGFVTSLYSYILPALIKTVQVCTIWGFVSYLLRFILAHIFTKSTSAMTIIKLLNNVIKYVFVIIIILVALAAWGVDTSTLLASAGIMALVVGLGAQSLIGDVIAGCFIVFEGNFKIGDIVVIDGWRGTVEEIGLRTSRIVDAGGNVKIINNSNIVTIINNTQQFSLAKCTVGIEYGESIKRVEAVIAKNLDAIREAIPAITEGPYYKGIDELGASSVNLLFVAKCKEQDLYQVQRDMNRQLKLIFDDNDINIPFTQITLNQPPEFVHEETRRDAHISEAFVEQQREDSKELEKDNG
ncbi:MAG: mechanosensitive ion channel family protein [Clostridia bacterium]|nr:mechanosensitive ion channel family protein [Clostridia bacterium]